jgi:hypothetical protein
MRDGKPVESVPTKSSPEAGNARCLGFIQWEYWAGDIVVGEPLQVGRGEAGRVHLDYIFRERLVGGPEVSPRLEEENPLLGRLYAVPPKDLGIIR